MEDDIDWAMDWSQPDDWHSRLDGSWVGETFREGMWEGASEALLDFVDPLGMRRLGGDSSTQPMAGNVTNLIKLGYRAARTANRLAPAARLALSAAKKLQLVASTSPAKLAQVFKRLGYKVDREFVDRMRGVGPLTGRGQRDKYRMSGLGLKTADDVIDILRKGSVTILDEGKVLISYKRAAIVMNPVTKKLISIIGSSW
jgi:hypothetical protein